MRCNGLVASGVLVSGFWAVGVWTGKGRCSIVPKLGLKVGAEGEGGQSLVVSLLFYGRGSGVENRGGCQPWSLEDLALDSVGRVKAMSAGPSWLRAIFPARPSFGSNEPENKSSSICVSEFHCKNLVSGN